MSLITKVFAADGELGSLKPSNMKIDDLGKLISSLLTTAFIIAAVLTFAYLVWGGIDWLTSGGDKTKTENARNRITAALVGLAIVAASYAIMKLLETFFGISVTSGITLPTPYSN